MDVDAFLVTFPPHLRYMTGFSGSNGCALITRDSQAFITDGRYVQQVADEVHGFRLFVTQDTLYTEMKERRLLRPGMRVGVDGNTLTLAEFRQIKKIFPKVKFLPKVETIEAIAAVKDEDEIALIKRAVGISDRVFREVLPLLKPGMLELEIAAEISYRQRLHGSEADAFEPIVASGDRGALPHGRATIRKIRRGDMITLDFGCVVGGYHSDLTRTVALGDPPAECRRIHAIVLEAQRKAIDSAASGMKASDLDAVARRHIADHGYDKFFRHSLGHGIGLQIHEPPRISTLSRAVLRTGNVITVEPGIYIPGLGGVRIEDDIVIRNGRAEVLNRVPRELLIL